jgi:DNA-binding PadR family transcriptional regulator
MSVYSREYYLANRDKLLANNKKYRRTDKGKANIRRYKLKAGKPKEIYIDNMSLQEIRELLLKQEQEGNDDISNSQTEATQNPAKSS